MFIPVEFLDTSCTCITMVFPGLDTAKVNWHVRHGCEWFVRDGGEMGYGIWDMAIVPKAFSRGDLSCGANALLIDGALGAATLYA